MSDISTQPSSGESASAKIKQLENYLKNHKGIALVGAGLIGYIGYKLYENHKNSSSTAATTSSTGATIATDTGTDTGGTWAGGYGTSTGGGGSGGGSGSGGGVISTDLSGIDSDVAGLASGLGNFETTYATNESQDQANQQALGQNEQSLAAEIAQIENTSKNITVNNTATPQVGTIAQQVIGNVSDISVSQANQGYQASIAAGANPQQAAETALQHEVPVGQETDAQRHAQEVANKSLRSIATNGKK